MYSLDEASIMKKNQLEIKNLTLFRGNRCLFKDLSFAINNGEVVIVKGDNGSGKTSLLRAVAGLIEPDHGCVYWNKKDITNIRQLYHQNMVWLSHKHGFKGQLNIEENLYYESGLREGFSNSFDETFEKLSLTSIKHQPFNTLSAGQKMRASIARLILSKASLCLLDEPTSNLDTKGRDFVNFLINYHINNGGMCILATYQSSPIKSSIKEIVLS